MSEERDRAITEAAALLHQARANLIEAAKPGHLDRHARELLTGAERLLLQACDAIREARSL